MNDNEINKYNIEICLPDCFDKVILVDCMDTVLYRDLSLESILKIWSKKASKHFGINRSFLSNYRSEVVSSAMHNTVPIDTIYSEIYDHCSHFGLINSIQKNEFVRVSHQIELEIELKYLHVIPEIVEFLRKSKTCGAQIYCVSDFRLSGADIKEFFSQQNIDTLFDDIFSSCDYGITKKDGRFYSLVLEKIHKTPSECIMIGDNLKSDCVNASKNGIKSYWIQKKKTSYFSLLKDLIIRFS
jgi:FMN phosphatase YigB (HAD superfamily)